MMKLMKLMKVTEMDDWGNREGKRRHDETPETLGRVIWKSLADRTRVAHQLARSCFELAHGESGGPLTVAAACRYHVRGPGRPACRDPCKVD